MVGAVAGSRLRIFFASSTWPIFIAYPVSSFVRPCGQLSMLYLSCRRLSLERGNPYPCMPSVSVPFARHHEEARFRYSSMITIQI